MRINGPILSRVCIFFRFTTKLPWLVLPRSLSRAAYREPNAFPLRDWLTLPLTAHYAKVLNKQTTSRSFVVSTRSSPQLEPRALVSLATYVQAASTSRIYSRLLTSDPWLLHNSEPRHRQSCESFSSSLRARIALHPRSLCLSRVAVEKDSQQWSAISSVHVRDELTRAQARCSVLPRSSLAPRTHPTLLRIFASRDVADHDSRFHSTRSYQLQNRLN